MPVEVPAERTYYYECSRGQFRLILFIPPKELERLKAEGLDNRAIHDFPDGLDLTCTEPDFAEFHRLYGYRPEHDPNALRNAFYSLWTDTKGWQRETQVGFIPAPVIEGILADVAEAAPIMRADAPPKPKEGTDRRASLKDRRRFTNSQQRQQKQQRSALKRLHSKVIDRSRSLNEQEFGKISMEEGEVAQELFIRVNQKKAT